MKYEDAAAFRQALLSRLRSVVSSTGIPFERLRKRLVFERLLARLLKVAPKRWALKGALALDFRFQSRARTTKDADLIGTRNVEEATEDLIAVQTVDLQDHFAFVVRRSRETDPNHPEPSVSFHVTAQVAGLVFDEATIDVEAQGSFDWEPDVVTSDLLAFAGLEPVAIPVIPLEVQVAEKLHAYTRTYGKRQRASARVKDLIDLALIVETAALDAGSLRAALDCVFTRRATHTLPATLPPPPADWSTPYRAMAKQVGVNPDPAIRTPRGRSLPGSGDERPSRRTLGSIRPYLEDSGSLRGTPLNPYWSGRWDLNPRPSAWEAATLD